MIEINLLPGTGKKPRNRSAGIDLAGVIGKITAHVKDPYLIAAVASWFRGSHERQSARNAE